MGLMRCCCFNSLMSLQRWKQMEISGGERGRDIDSSPSVTRIYFQLALSYLSIVCFRQLRHMLKKRNRGRKSRKPNTLFCYSARWQPACKTWRKHLLFLWARRRILDLLGHNNYLTLSSCSPTAHAKLSCDWNTNEASLKRDVENE